MAKIKHIAMICVDPNKLADFYCDVFDMKVQLRRNGSVFLTDGYLNVALLAQTAEGKPNGLNHFGFHIENADVVAERMKKWNVVGPVKRPADRTYAETRATDPEGNNFDLTVGGFERSRQSDVVELQRQTEPTPA
jgi:catechol 2,3-dioxygenase-like lactoylglutathione lyase family enzyme